MELESAIFPNASDHSLKISRTGVAGFMRNSRVRRWKDIYAGAKKGVAGAMSQPGEKEMETRTTASSLIALLLACFALPQSAHALLPPPPPDGGYPNGNTAEGHNALFNLTSGSFNTAIGFNALFSNTTGLANSAVGWRALNSNTTGNGNTAGGHGALFSNTTGDDNAATGVQALFSNTTGSSNTANGRSALEFNTTGSSNTATGESALLSNTTGTFNTAVGSNALELNTTGGFNTATGISALNGNTTGRFNTASGGIALASNTIGSNNTASGYSALAVNSIGLNNTAVGYNALLRNTRGGNNIGLGVNAGANLSTGGNNIDIDNAGVAGESSKIRIGRQGTHNGTFIAGISGVAGTGSHVVVNEMGKLGVAASSARFKDDIKPIDKASEAIHALKPVTFRYKKEVDPEGVPQFGLIAEDVEKVNPDLVARDANGKAYTVRYEAVNAMLLNEFLKEHRKVEELTKDFQATVAELTARLDEQAAQIQKVSARIEASKPAPQVVSNP